jgi:hypothetical protein
MAFQNPQERLLRQVQKVGSCWNFTGWKDKDGYGRFWLDGRNQSAHKASLTLFRGAVLDGLLVLHSCDNPSCVNPAHLSLGTQKDNIQQAIRRGRRAQVKPPVRRGEKNARAKLTEQQVREIRVAYRPGVCGLAKRYGVTRSTIRSVATGRTWKHAL